jgi:hypothetical protein
VIDKQRLLATIVAIPVGVGAGFVVGVLIIGAPHMIPGPLLNEPDPLRYTVLNTIMVVTPLLFVVGVWMLPIGSKPKSDTVHPATRASTQIATADLSAAFRKKPTAELEALVATKPQGVYPARTYQLAEEVLKERRSIEAS